MRAGERKISLTIRETLFHTEDSQSALLQLLFTDSWANSLLRDSCNKWQPLNASFAPFFLLYICSPPQQTHFHCWKNSTVSRVSSNAHRHHLWRISWLLFPKKVLENQEMHEPPRCTPIPNCKSTINVSKRCTGFKKCPASGKIYCVKSPISCIFHQLLCYSPAPLGSGNFPTYML